MNNLNRFSLTNIQKDFRATAIFFAGVNGAGKTTLYFKAQEHKIHLGYRINVDEISQSIGNPNDKETIIRAAKIAINMRNMYIENQFSFNQETTLCGNSIIKLFKDLQENNFKINLFYVGLDSVKTAKERVAIRVSKGGHNIAQHLVEKRYYESLLNLLKIIEFCDDVLIYDNTLNFELVAEIKAQKILQYKKIDWLEKINITNILNGLNKNK